MSWVVVKLKIKMEPYRGRGPGYRLGSNDKTVLDTQHPSPGSVILCLVSIWVTGGAPGRPLAATQCQCFHHPPRNQVTPGHHHQPCHCLHF